MQFKSLIFAPIAMAAVALAQSSGPMVNTPSPLIQCQTYQLSFSGGTAPYNLYATKQGQTSDILDVIAMDVSSNTYSWKVNLASGTAITIYIVDSTGASNSSGPATIQSSSDSSCLGTAQSTGSASAASSTGSSGSTSSSGSSSTSSRSSGSSTTSNAGSSQTSSSSSSSSTSSGKNGASQLSGFSAAVAGAVGVAVAALI